MKLDLLEEMGIQLTDYGNVESMKFLQSVNYFTVIYKRIITKINSIWDSFNYEHAHLNDISILIAVNVNAVVKWYSIQLITGSPVKYFNFSVCISVLFNCHPRNK
jgi:hypothetical protein